MECQQGLLSHLKAQLRLEEPLLRWPHTAVGRRPQFLPMWTLHRAAGVSSQHGSLSEWLDREQGRRHSALYDLISKVQRPHFHLILLITSTSPGQPTLEKRELDPTFSRKEDQKNCGRILKSLQGLI